MRFRTLARLLYLILATIGIGFSAAAASPGGFEGSPGQPPAGWQITDGQGGAASGGWELAPDESGGRALKTVMSRSPSFLERRVEGGDGAAVLELRVRTHSAVTRRGLGFGLSRGDPGPMTQRGVYLAFLGNGYLAAHDGISFRPVARYRPAAWMTVRLEVSTRLGGLKVWVDGEPAGSGLYPLTHWQPSLDRVFLSNDGPDPEQVLVSAVSVRGASVEAPGRVTLTERAGEVALEWPRVEGASGYRVYRGGTAIAEVPQPSSGEAARHVDREAPSGRACSYTVSALRGEEESLPTWPAPVLVGALQPPSPRADRYDVVVYGGTPGGVAAALAAARRGASVALLSHNGRVGGMVSGGLGQTDLRLRQAASGLFVELISRVREFYRQAYGPDSLQFADCGNGYWIEPSVAELLFRHMLGEQPLISVAYDQRLVDVEAVPLHGNRWASRRVTALRVEDRSTGQSRRYEATTFIDASYEGDLAARAGARYRIGREARSDHGEEYAGVIYWDWDTGKLVEGTTGEGDNRLQAYCYRLTLTNRASNRVPIPRPEGYDPALYASIARDVAEGKIKAISQVIWFGKLPNEKYDINNMGRYWPSTDFIEENTDYPEASEERRREIERAHRDWALGLLYYLQNDPALPESFRQDALQWGLPADEHPETGHFPMQMYVREARRILGRALFTELDARSPDKDIRAPLHRDSVAVAEYPLDSHATRKRQPSHPNQLEGFFYLPFVTRPSQVPYGVLTPEGIDGLLVCVATSGTHVGNSTIRLEPIYMALGEVCGTVAARNARLGVPPHFAASRPLQDDLQSRGGQLSFLEDLPSTDPSYRAFQYWGTQGFLPSYAAKASNPADRVTAAEWIFRFLAREDRRLWDRVGLPPEAVDPNAARSARLGLRKAGEEAKPDRTELPEEETAAARKPETDAYVRTLGEMGVLEPGAEVTREQPLTWGQAAIWTVRGKRAIGLWGRQADLTEAEALDVLRGRGVLPAGFPSNPEAPITRGELVMLLYRARN